MIERRYIGATYESRLRAILAYLDGMGAAIYGGQVVVHEYVTRLFSGSQAIERAVITLHRIGFDYTWSIERLIVALGAKTYGEWCYEMTGGK